MSLKKKPFRLSEDCVFSLKLGSAVSAIVFVIGAVWTAATEWYSLQQRLKTAEQTIAWHTAAIKSLKK